VWVLQFCEPKRVQSEQVEVLINILKLEMYSTWGGRE